MATNINMVAQALAACGLNAAESVRVATEMFDNNFSSCIYMSIEDLESNLKSFHEFTIAKGRIRFTPSIKKNVKAFVQWSKDRIRAGLDPAAIPFPIMDAKMPLRRQKTHNVFV